MNTRVRLSGAVSVTPAPAEPHHHFNAEDTVAIVPPPLMPSRVGNEDPRPVWVCVPFLMEMRLRGGASAALKSVWRTLLGTPLF